LWALVAPWQCYFYVTDGWSVYPGFIPDGDQIVSKTYMTRVESENTRLRHYLARLHRKTLCYSKSEQMLRHKGSIVTALSQILGCPCSKLIHILIQQRPHNNAACRHERDRALQLYNILTKEQKEQIPQVLRVWLRYRSEKYFGPHRTPPQSKSKHKRK